MRLSDMLTQYIMEMIDSEGNAEIKRNELSDRFGCVPSQINFPLYSRAGIYYRKPSGWRGIHPHYPSGVR